MVEAGLYGSSGSGAESDGVGVTRWRVAPEPLALPLTDIAALHRLGSHLLSFYRALNRLYMESVRGAEPAWIAGYLDQGKPESLVAYSRMKRFRNELPAVIRPDIIPVERQSPNAEMVITELDSVPGGIGLTDCLSKAYAALDVGGPTRGIVGGADGMVNGFAAMLRRLAGSEETDTSVAIVVSEEAKDYRPEMQWLAGRLRDHGVAATCVEPRDVRFREEGLFVPYETGERRVSVLYRFFELFDVINVPKAELIMYAAKKQSVRVTPPFKPALEEKLAFALVHHPALAPFWERELGEEAFGSLSAMMPRTWILDPRPIPPQAVIPDLRIAGRPVAGWNALKEAGQKDRRYVIKPSGFSELAWGSRGVTVGHDVPQSEWAAAVDHALAAYETTPYVLQEFHKGRQFEMSYLDEAAGTVRPMPARVRLSPYYFVTGDEASLGGILATACSLDKKVIHGMKDAIMVPVTEATDRS
jgi:hypothetical protein